MARARQKVTQAKQRITNASRRITKKLTMAKPRSINLTKGKGAVSGERATAKEGLPTSSLLKSPRESFIKCS